MGDFIQIKEMYSKEKNNYGMIPFSIGKNVQN